MTVLNNHGTEYSITSKHKLIWRHKGHIIAIILLLAGDIHPQPGPIKHPCMVCKCPVHANHRALKCDICKSWGHIKCVNITLSEYKNMCNVNDFDWTCPVCCDITRDLPFAETSQLSSCHNIVWEPSHQA